MNNQYFENIRSELERIAEDPDTHPDDVQWCKQMLRNLHMGVEMHLDEIDRLKIGRIQPRADDGVIDNWDDDADENESEDDNYDAA